MLNICRNLSLLFRAGEKQVRLLKELGVDKLKRSTFDENLSRYRKFLSDQNRPPQKCDHIDEGRSLYNWVRNTVKKSNLPNLTESQIEQLEEAGIHISRQA